MQIIAGPAGFSQDAAAEKPEQFSALLGAAVGKFKAAESGNKTPLLAQQPAAADIKAPRAVVNSGSCRVAPLL